MTATKGFLIYELANSEEYERAVKYAEALGVSRARVDTFGHYASLFGWCADEKNTLGALSWCYDSGSLEATGLQCKNCSKKEQQQERQDADREKRIREKLKAKAALRCSCKKEIHTEKCTLFSM